MVLKMGIGIIYALMNELSLLYSSFSLPSETKYTNPANAPEINKGIVAAPRVITFKVDSKDITENGTANAVKPKVV